VSPEASRFTPTPALRFFPMGEPQIILKTDRRNVILELGLGENSKQNQAAGTRTEPFSKALFLKLQYAMAAGC
jgi:hypothetical protein